MGLDLPGLAGRRSTDARVGGRGSGGRGPRAGLVGAGLALGAQVILRITIHDAPQGKGRPRFARASGRTFTPARTRAWEARAATAVADALPAGWTPPRLARL